jgi:hypothetical protein
MEPQLLPLDAATLGAYYPWCLRGLRGGADCPPSARATCAAMCARLFPDSLALSPSAPGGDGSGPSAVLELLGVLADLAGPRPSPASPAAGWWGLRAAALAAAAPCLAAGFRRPLPGDAGGRAAAAVAAAARHVVAAALAPTDGGRPATAGAWRLDPAAAARALPPGLRRAAAAALAGHVGKAYDDGAVELPPFGPVVLGLLYALPPRDRNLALGLAGSHPGSSGGSSGGGGRGDGGGAGGCLSGCDCLALAQCLAADVRAKKLSNLEVEHLAVLAACVYAHCAAAQAATSSAAGPAGPAGPAAGAGEATAVASPLSGGWPLLYADLKAWLLVALCDPDAAALAASVVEAFATRSPLRDQVTRDALWLPSLKLCFPNGGGAGDPTCEAVFAQLLRRLSGAGPRHAVAVDDLLASSAPPPGSPLAALAAELRG